MRGCTGQEAAFAKSRGLPEAASSLEPALLSRLLLCHYAGLVSSLDQPLQGPHLPSSAAAQALQLHTILRQANTCSASPAQQPMTESAVLITARLAFNLQGF